jgi:trans-AT polyketide synthase/acyltransferase/oxidoreductase domain-containing protein
MSFGSIDEAMAATASMPGALLARLDEPVYALADADGRVALSHRPDRGRIVGSVPAISAGQLGSPTFRARHAVDAAYVAGEMAGGIGSVEMCSALARAGFIGGYGAGGLELDEIRSALRRLRDEVPAGRSYIANLLHAPQDEALELRTAQLYLDEGVRRVSASAFMALTEAVVLYRARGLSALPDGGVRAENHVLAKISRPEVAEEFMRPAPDELLERLVARELLSPTQAALARRVPVAEDVTSEGDSGGHTDRRPAIPLLSTIVSLRDRIQGEQRYPQPVRVGAAGGIGTPAAVAAAFIAGADFVMTGSVNQACVEARTSGTVKALLARVGVGGIEMAPAADMFELGVQVQVMKQGTLFAPRARRLYQLWQSHDGWLEIAERERRQIESQYFRATFDEVWAEVQRYLAQRAPTRLAEAEHTPKLKLALVFRWYLGMSSRWARDGVPERKVDYQVWCGAAMAAFNAWARGTHLERPEGRTVVAVARALLDGAARLMRARLLALQGVALPAEAFDDRPRADLEENA